MCVIIFEKLTISARLCHQNDQIQSQYGSPLCHHIISVGGALDYNNLVKQDFYINKHTEPSHSLIYFDKNILLYIILCINIHSYGSIETAAVSLFKETTIFVVTIDADMHVKHIIAYVYICLHTYI